MQRALLVVFVVLAGLTQAHAADAFSEGALVGLIGGAVGAIVVLTVAWMRRR